MDFIVIRLGKDSLNEIEQLINIGLDEFQPFEFDFTCKQVEKSITEGSYAFIYLGSDNNKGIPTKWKQGLRAMAKLEKINNWTSFQSECTLKIKVLSIFPNSYDQFDFLDESPHLYRHFSQYPIIGVKSSRNNSVQKVNVGERENTSALLTALKHFNENFKSDIDVYANELTPLLNFSTRITGTSNKTSEGKGRNIIFYGAPGTGKSYKVNKLVEGHEERTERVTFHPEFDYASFIGGYKPSMNGNDIRYEFVPQIFTTIYVRAWKDLNNTYYLIIEEINRGNCAEIFGDIFQLLDRTSNYKITPSKELKEYLEKEFATEENIDSSKLILPSNLTLLATMNTSDQSLFPMDSAFKRRWEWEYIPIDYSISESNPSSNFIVKLNDGEYFSWLEFIKVVNEMIKENENLGMDKCLGNYFITPKTESIGINDFINKAIFYLWNDVFKDESEEYSIFKNKTTYEDFFPIIPNGVEKVKGILTELNIEITNHSIEQ